MKPVILNPSTLRRPSTPGTQDCTNYNDSPTCTNASTDVTCGTEVYKGCQPGMTDCANSPDNPDDSCCAGMLPGIVGDNIDHQFCSTNDAGHGGFGTCFWDDSGHEPYNLCPDCWWIC